MTDREAALPGDPYAICDNLVKIYKVADLEVVALQGLDLVINRGEFMAIIGNSGSGKSSLLNILGGLDSPSAGSCVVGGMDLVKASESDLVFYKRYKVGFIWQQSGLQPDSVFDGIRERPDADAVRKHIRQKPQGQG